MRSDRGQRFGGTASAATTSRDRGRALAAPSVVVGNAVYHTVGDREQAVRQLALDIDAFYHDVGTQLGQIGTGPGGAFTDADRSAWALHPLWQLWWTGTAAPFFAAWATFKAQQLTGDTTGPGGAYIAYGERFATDWPVYQDWHERLVALRASASKAGIPIHAPHPTDLPTTFAEDVKNKVERVAESALDLGKVALYGAIGLGGLYLLSIASAHGEAA